MNSALTAETAQRQINHSFETMSYRPSVVSVVEFLDSPGRPLLLVHSSKAEFGNGWNLPCGGVEPGESLTEATERELEEELNLNPSQLYVREDPLQILKRANGHGQAARDGYRKGKLLIGMACEYRGATTDIQLRDGELSHSTLVKPEHATSLVMAGTEVDRLEQRARRIEKLLSVARLL